MSMQFRPFDDSIRGTTHDLEACIACGAVILEALRNFRSRCPAGRQRCVMKIKERLPQAGPAPLPARFSKRRPGHGATKVMNALTRTIIAKNPIRMFRNVFPGMAHPPLGLGFPHPGQNVTVWEICR